MSDYIAKGADYMLVGAGDPNVLGKPANRTRFYMDTVALKLYMNPVIGARTGWVLV